MFARSLILAAVVLGVASCTQPANIKPVTAGPVKEIAQGTDAAPIQFRKVVIKMPRGYRIGALLGGLLCIPNGDFIYRGGRGEISDSEFTDTFIQELKKANYPVVGDSDTLFDDPNTWRAEILVAGLVTDLQANICVQQGGGSMGKANIKVEWQIYSRLERQVVLKVTAEGFGETNTPRQGGGNDAIYSAFAMATQNLLGDQGFHDLVQRKTPGSPTSSTTPAAPISIKPRPPFTGALTSRISQIQSAVVTVFAGSGHGSGFFIDADGYIITDSHVVENARVVKVKLSDGKELTGDVVGSDRKRDVALVRVQGSGFSALPASPREPVVGTEVYALGAPLSERFSNTMTRGIVSGYREQFGQRFLQSDVSIQPGDSGGPLVDPSGNVVGVTDISVRIGGAGAGINFFIPIDEALRALTSGGGAATTGASLPTTPRAATDG